MAYGIGIDIGMLNMRFAANIDAMPQIISNNDGGRETPSVVAFRISRDGNKETLVGMRAQNQLLLNSANTFYHLKKLIGKQFSEVQPLSANLTYKISADASRNNAVCIVSNGKTYTPQELLAALLRNAKESAERYLGAQVTEAVLTVPTYFNDSQRQAVKDAASIAGLTVKRIINEAKAALLAYELLDQNRTVAICNFGNTVDCTIVRIENQNCETISSARSQMNENPIDHTISDFITKKVFEQSNLDLRTLSYNEYLAASQRISVAAENLKRALSNTMSYDVSLPYLAMYNGTPVNFEYTFSRAKLEEFASPFCNEVIKVCHQALSEANVEPSQIDEIILIGGLSRMSIISETVKKVFQKELNMSVNPEEAVAIGAAIQVGL